MRSKIDRDLIWRSYIRQKEIETQIEMKRNTKTTSFLHMRREEKTFFTNEKEFSFFRVIQKPNPSSILISIVHLWQISQVRAEGGTFCPPNVML